MPNNPRRIMGKISLSNIAEELAVKGGLTREAANTFMHAFVETIEKGLKEDGIVKVKGLGTFKLQEMNDRDSVDVNTGERITIKGYRKVTFTPDSAMKEMVNRPFAHFEPTELNDAYPDEEEPVVLDTLAEEEGEAETEVSVEAIPEVASEVETVAIAESETSAHAEEVADTAVTVEVKEHVEDEIASEAVVEEGNTTEELGTEAETLSVVDPVEEVAEQDDAVEVADTNVAEAKVDEQVVEDIEKRSEEGSKTIEKKQRRGGCWWGTLLVLLLFIAGLYFFYGYFHVESSEAEETELHDVITVRPNLEEELGAEWGDEVEVKTSSVASMAEVKTEKESTPPMEDKPKSLEVASKENMPVQATDVSVAQTDAIVPEVVAVVLTDALRAKAIKDISIADTTDYVMEGTLVEHRLKRGETIIQLSNRYYGDKRLWPYIVRYNNMKDFNKVAIGQKIKVPVLKEKTIE